MTMLSYGAPKEVGMDPDRIAALKNRAPDWVDGFRMRSAVLLAARRGNVVFHEAYGPLRSDAASPAVVRDTIFAVNSITKVITATVAMTLVEDGKLGLNRPVREYLPEMCGQGADDIEVQHLLSHTSGLDEAEMWERAGRLYKNYNVPVTPEEGQVHPFVEGLLERIWDLKVHHAPGSVMSYSNVNFALLAEVVRRVCGGSLEEFARERLFIPLGMKDTSMTWDPGKAGRQVRRGDGVPFGSSANNPMGGNEGHWLQSAPWGFVGASSTALDLARFGQMFLGNGALGGNRVLSPASVHEMTRNQIPGIKADIFGVQLEASWGLGWAIQGDFRWRWGNGTLTPKGTFYHTGAGGHVLWVDPVNEIVGVYLSVCLDIDMEIVEPHGPNDLFQNMVTAAVAD